MWFKYSCLFCVVCAFGDIGIFLVPGAPCPTPRVLIKRNTNHQRRESTHIKGHKLARYWLCIFPYCNVSIWHFVLYFFSQNHKYGSILWFSIVEIITLNKYVYKMFALQPLRNFTFRTVSNSSSFEWCVKAILTFKTANESFHFVIGLTKALETKTWEPCSKFLPRLVFILLLKLVLN